jgi:hypothetical protein
MDSAVNLEQILSDYQINGPIDFKIQRQVTPMTIVIC